MSQENVKIFDLEKKIIYFKEIETQSPASVYDNFAKIAKLSRDFDGVYLLIDLSIAKRPNYASRKALNTSFLSLRKEIIHVAFYTEGNFLINAAIKFVMYNMGLASYSVKTTKAEALSSIKKASSKH